MTDVGRRVAADLLRIEAVQLRPDAPFTWASGIVAPLYTDNRLTLGYPEVRGRICDGFTKLMEQHQIQPAVVVGTATAGIPHAAWLAHRCVLPMAYVRAKPKAHGRGNQIEGVLKAGQRVVIVEDLISTGGSSIEAVQVVRAAGADVLAVLAIFSYNLARATVAFAEARVAVHTLTNLDLLVEVAGAQGTLTGPQQQHVLDWRDRLNQNQ